MDLGVFAHFEYSYLFKIVPQAELFKGELPKVETAIHHGDKLHQIFDNTRIALENLLAGYCLPDPYFKDRLKIQVDTLMKCLRDPALPLFKLQASPDSKSE